MLYPVSLYMAILTLGMLALLLCGVLHKQLHSCSACVQQPAHVS